jgi:hypothetical protein
MTYKAFSFGKNLRLSAFFRIGILMGRVPNVCQTFVEGFGTCSPCSVNEIICYPGQQWTEGQEAMRYFIIVSFNGLLTEDG